MRKEGTSLGVLIGIGSSIVALSIGGMVVVYFTFHDDPVQFVTVLGISVGMLWIGSWSQWTLDEIWCLLSERYRLRRDYVSAEKCLNRVVLMTERRDALRRRFADVYHSQNRLKPLSLDSRGRNRP